MVPAPGTPVGGERPRRRPPEGAGGADAMEAVLLLLGGSSARWAVALVRMLTPPVGGPPTAPCEHM